MRPKLFFILALLLGADIALADSFTATGALNLTIGTTGGQRNRRPALWRWSPAAIPSRNRDDWLQLREPWRSETTSNFP